MFLSWLALATIACSSVNASWQVAIYENIGDGCYPAQDTRFRLLEGNADDCITLGGEMGNTECGEYKNFSNGGLNGPTGCVGDQLWPRAAKYYDISMDGFNCKFYISEGCQGSELGGGTNGCSAIVPGGPSARVTFRSFHCKK